MHNLDVTPPDPRRARNGFGEHPARDGPVDGLVQGGQARVGGERAHHRGTAVGRHVHQQRLDA